MAIWFIFIIFPCHCAVYMYKIMILQKPLSQFHIDPSVEMWLIVYSNDHAPLTVRPIYSSSKLRTVQMMIFSLVAMIGLEKCCILSACLQWLCHPGEPASVAQLDAPSDWRPGGRGFNPRRGRQHSFVEIDHEIFYTVILSLPLIQEGQLSLSGERMHNTG